MSNWSFASLPFDTPEWVAPTIQIVLDLGRGWSPEEVEEVAEDVVLKVWFSPSYFQPDAPDSPRYRKLIQKTALNLLRDRYRKAQRRAEKEALPFEVAAKSHEPAAEMIGRECEAALRQIISGLSPRRRAVVRLARDGHTHEEIARKLGLERRTVRSHLRYARAKIAEALQETGR